MRDYPLVGCGHCGVGVVPRLASHCPFRQEPVCELCFTEVMRLVTDLQAKGRDPLPKPRRRSGTRKPASARPLL
jgi:hypothetical protein